MAGEQVRVELAGVPASVHTARALVRDAVGAWGLDGLGDTAALLTSEMATNAVLHARSSFLVEVRRTPQGMRVSVSDRSAGVPTPRRHGPTAGTGRGLAMVEQLATRWGSAGSTGSYAKTVWFELAV